MRKSICWWLIVCAAILLGGPAITCYGVYHQDAMAVLLLQLMLINPAWMIVTGIVTGKAFRQLWSLPLIAAVLFLAGAWLFYAPGSRDFLWYTGAYLCIAYGAAAITCWVHKRKTAAKS